MTNTIGRVETLKVYCIRSNEAVYYYDVSTSYEAFTLIEFLRDLECNVDAYFGLLVCKDDCDPNDPYDWYEWRDALGRDVENLFGLGVASEDVGLSSGSVMTEHVVDDSYWSRTMDQSHWFAGETEGVSSQIPEYSPLEEVVDFWFGFDEGEGEAGAWLREEVIDFGSVLGGSTDITSPWFDHQVDMDSWFDDLIAF